jgi:hypothetical protein
MKPPRPEDTYTDFDREEAEAVASYLRGCFELWADAAEGDLRDPRLKPAKLPQLDARRNEIWRILFRIADLAGGRWPEAARVAAIALSGRDRRQQDTSNRVQLLAHIRELFVDERMSCSVVVEGLNADERLPYGGWSDGKGISTRELGKKLAPYGIHAQKIRFGERTMNASSSRTPGAATSRIWTLKQEHRNKWLNQAQNRPK